jgi:hypothetical protein
VILSHDETVAFEKILWKRPKASSWFTAVAQLQIAACKRHSVLAFFQMSILNKRVLMKHGHAREERNILALRAQIKGAETMTSAAQLHRFLAQCRCVDARTQSDAASFIYYHAQETV